MVSDMTFFCVTRKTRCVFLHLRAYNARLRAIKKVDIDNVDVGLRGGT